MAQLLDFMDIIHIIHFVHKAPKPLKILGLRTFYLFHFPNRYDTISLLNTKKEWLGKSMSQFKVYKDYSSDATLVSNIFIDHYMQNANDAQIKIYLYLLRVLSAHMNCSISDLADQFNYTEKDVVRALKYWEKNNLLALDYDEAKSLCGVRMLDVVERNNSTISLATVVPMPVKKADAVSPVSSDYNDANVNDETVDEKPAYIKPSYSNSEVLNFKKDASCGELVFVVEQYIGKPLTPSEIKTLLFFYDVLEFSPELIDYLFQYCVDRGKKAFSYIETVAIAWKEAGITTVKQAKSASAKYDKNVYKIMKALGQTNAPTDAEVRFIDRWTKEWAFNMDIIIEACERTVLATDKRRFAYADGILSSWNTSGVHHKADIDKLDSEHAKASKVKPIPQGGSSSSYRQFSQREYDFDSLEKEIMSN